MKATQTKSDAQIKRDVLAELKWDPRIDEWDVGVEVDNGVVTLTGTVVSYAKRFAAQEAAHLVGGVLDVANDIKVKLPGSSERTDTEVAQAVRDALRWDVTVPHERIQTTISRGAVTLEGTVDYWYQRDAAERAVRNLFGVTSVVDRLRLAGHPVAADTVKKSIEDALERRAERAARRVTVTLSGSTVRVSGSVRTWQEKEAVVAAARFTPGVQDVEDALRIDPLA
jgi:osmotically-inducible protein OsmY